MAFSENEKKELLKLKGVGDKVIERFEQIGIDSFEKLAQNDAKSIANKVSLMLKTTCWKNSPQALAAIKLAIEIAKEKRAKI